MKRPYRWIPCFNAHPETGRACQRRGGHKGKHRCGYPGGCDHCPGEGWVRNPRPRNAKQPTS